MFSPEHRQPAAITSMIASKIVSKIVSTIVTAALVALAVLAGLATTAPAGARTGDGVANDTTLAASSASAPGEAVPATGDPPPYGPGELLEFSIDYGVINAGGASLEILDIVEYQGHRCYHIQSRATSNRFFSSFYKVRDKVVSYLDVNHQFSRYFSKRLREGNYRKTVEISFDHVEEKAHYADGNVFDTVSGVQDVLSAFFYVRTLDLEVGAVYDVPTHSSRKTYDLKVIVHGMETVEVGAGTFECFVVEPKIIGDGLFKHEGKLTIYISADEYKMPVLMKTKVPVGSIDASLTEYRLGRPLRPEAIPDANDTDE